MPKSSGGPAGSSFSNRMGNTRDAVDRMSFVSKLLLVAALVAAAGGIAAALLWGLPPLLDWLSNYNDQAQTLTIWIGVIGAIIAAIAAVVVRLIRLLQTPDNGADAGSSEATPEATAPQTTLEESPKTPIDAVDSGALPPIWNVPHRRNPNFTGRDAQLEELHTNLASHTTTALTALRGTGGVGKTQLATEYAFRHASDYEAVWWVRSDNAAQFASDYAGLAIAVGAVGADEADQKVQIGAAKAWLEHNGEWLLILDNVPRPDEIEDYLPSGGTGDILITSRFQNWGGVGDVISVDTWPRDDSIDFLLARTGLDDRDTAGALAEELGDLPLALEHVGAYVEEIDCSLGRYLELFKERRSDMIALAKPPADYDETVATTWGISIDMVADENPAAVELLNICAFLAPDEIPLDIIRDGTEFLPAALAAAADDDLAWNHVLATLRRYSLVEVSGNALSLHRLVQATTLARLGKASGGVISNALRILRGLRGRDTEEEESLRKWASAAVLVINRAHSRSKAISPRHGPCAPVWPLMQ